MDWSGGQSQEQQAESKALAPLPRVWIGYLSGVATMIAEMIAVTVHPELAKEPLLIPPLYLFLANFISLIYWLVCVYEYHVVLAQATAVRNRAVLLTPDADASPALWTLHQAASRRTNVVLLDVRWLDDAQIRNGCRIAEFTFTIAAAEAPSNGAAGIYSLCRVSCAGPRTWHDAAVLGGIVSVAVPALCAGRAAGTARGTTTFFVIFHSEESKCRERHAGSCQFF